MSRSSSALCSRTALVGLLALGDVDRRADRAHERPVRQEPRHGGGCHPPVDSVGAAGPDLEMHGPPLRGDRSERLLAEGQVIGMDQPIPAMPEQALQGDAAELGSGPVDECAAEPRVGHGDDHRGAVGHQAESLLALADGLLGLHPLGQVVEDDHQERAAVRRSTGVRVTSQGNIDAVVDPADPPVEAAEALAAGGGVVIRTLDRSQAAVGLDLGAEVGGVLAAAIRSDRWQPKRSTAAPLQSRMPSRSSKSIWASDDCSNSTPEPVLGLLALGHVRGGAEDLDAAARPCRGGRRPRGDWSHRQVPSAWRARNSTSDTCRRRPPRNGPGSRGTPAGRNPRDGSARS